MSRMSRFSVIAALAVAAPVAGAATAMAAPAAFTDVTTPAAITVAAGNAASSQTAVSLTSGPSASATRTRGITVRPVRANGTPVPGWKVVSDRSLTVTCDETSPNARSNGIVSCSPSAAYATACWKSTRHTVLCLQDPRSHTLVRMRYSGTIPTAKAPRRPTPLSLRLSDGQWCAVRVGGAWSTPSSHRDWYGTYSCGKGILLGNDARPDGINRSVRRWTVQQWLYGTDSTIVARRVNTAYYVGTAR